MGLKEHGFTFCISPDKTLGQWIHPVERKLLYQSWTDVTEWPDEQLVAFLMPQPEQQELFAT